ncbi:unnamed protein product [Cylindrotheca closterium]|uniref:Uncharacterized protein n=1 Tax=Cylindrotheca closterium TaxID=2856 RepID=A0AAD2PWS8_9STRA|nr:unnamed protein product [Cylindrotheca closterium]
MKTPVEVRQTLAKIKKNKETLFAVLLAGTRWYTGGLVMPLTFVICRLLLDRLMEQRISSIHRGKLATPEQLAQGDMNAQSLIQSYEEAMRMVDAEAKKNRDIQLEMEFIDSENQRLKALLDEANAQAIVSQYDSPRAAPSGNLQKKIDELEKLRSNLEEELKTERQAKQELESEKREAVAFRDAEARQNKIFKKEIERVKNDTKKMKEMETEISEKNDLIAKRDKAIAQLEQESGKKEQKIGELESNIQQLMATVDSLKEQMANLNESLDKERRVVQSLEGKLEETQQKVTEKGQLYDISMKSYGEEKEKNSSLQTKVIELNDTLDAERVKLQDREATIVARDDVIGRLKGFESKSHELTEELLSTVNELQDTKKRKESTEANLTSTMEKLSAVEEENKQIAVLNEQLDALELCVSEGEAALIAEKASLKTTAQERDATKAQLEDILAEKETLENQHNELKEKYEVVSDAMELLEAEKKTTVRLNGEVDTLTKSLEDSEAKNVSLQHTLNQKITITEAKVTMLAESESMNASLQQEISDLKKQVSKMSVALEDADVKEKRAEEIEAAFEAEKAKSAQLENKLEETTTALDEETTKASKLEKTLLDNKRMIEESEATIGSLEVFKQKAEEESQRAEEMKTEVSRLNNYLGSMRISVDDLQETLQEKENKIAELSAVNATLTTGKDDLASEYTASKAEQKQLHEQLEIMERKLKFENEKLATLSNQNQELKEVNLQSKEKLVQLQSSLSEKDAAIDSKDDEIVQLQNSLDESTSRFTEERSVAVDIAKDLRARNEKLQFKEAEALEKLEELKESSKETIQKLKASFEETKASLQEEQSKVQSLQEKLRSKEAERDEAIGGLTERMDGELADIKKQLADAKSKHEAEKAKVVVLESTRKGSQKMIHDLEAILDKKEILLERRMGEITTLKESLAESVKLCKAREARASEVEEKARKGEYSAELIAEMKTRENHMKKSLDDATQNTLKLKDMLLASGAFHGSTSKGPSLTSPRGKPTPETMSNWGK